MLHLILICLGFINPAFTFYCYWNTGCPYKYLSTETPYDSVRGDIRDSAVRLKGCEPVSIWGIYRHGKRQPSAYLCEEMKNAIKIRDLVVTSYKKHRSSLCAQDVENLLNWSLDNKFLDGKQDLTDEGINEMVGLGKRLKEAFPTLLGDLGDSNYTFRSAKGPWIEKSIKYFVKGLGSKKIKIDDPKPDTDVMAPNCGHIEKMPNQHHSEVEKYMSSSDYLAVKDRIQRRTGIEYSLSDFNVSALYDLCRYTWSDKASPWCALFTTDDLQVLEYIEDLKHYYKSGYGNINNERLGRIPLADLFKVFEDVKGGGGRSVVTYVTSDTILDQIYTALGQFKDSSPLSAASRNRDRKWRTSKLSVFSANLIAALYRCNSDSKQDHSVVFYLNEEPIRTICEEGVCSWQEFETKFRPFLTTPSEACNKTLS